MTELITAVPAQLATAAAAHAHQALTEALASQRKPVPHMCVQGPLCCDASMFLDHACPRDAFLTDPITVAYGAGEMVDLVSCAVCDRRRACWHPSCLAVIYSPCEACFLAAMHGAAAGES